jgi:hypothetical protein
MLTIAEREEIRRRWSDRNVGGYWGVNTRAWIRLIIANARKRVIA